MDFVTFGFIAMALVGLMTSEAILNADTLSVAISVPPRVAEVGFTRQTAEEIFAAEVKRIVNAPSTISRPSMRISSKKSVVGVLSEALQLGGLTTAIQDLFGQDTVRVTGALLKETENYRLVLTVSDRDSIPIQLDIRREDNDVVAVLRDGATATFERVAPYRVALGRFLAGIKGDQVQLARSRIDTRNALQQPVQRGRESEWAGLNTLDALHHLMANNTREAGAAFRRAYADPNIGWRQGDRRDQLRLHGHQQPGGGHCLEARPNRQRPSGRLEVPAVESRRLYRRRRRRCGLGGRRYGSGGTAAQRCRPEDAKG